MMSAWPEEANFLAQARPIPDVAPVMSTMLFMPAKYGSEVKMLIEISDVREITGSVQRILYG